MELRWLFNSLHFPAFSQGAYANAGHFIFSGDKTINTALKKQGLQENEDLRQSAILYMCKCLERFDPTKNIKWTTFAYKNIYLYIKREHNKEAAKQALLISTELFYFI